MKSVVRRLFVNFEKEEKWINDMAAKGMNFIDYSFSRYLFEKGTPGEYVYRIELLNNLPSHPESKAYIEFMEETGAECVSTYWRWVYFRKKAADGAFDIYSDYDSRIKHYKRVISLVAAVMILNIVPAISNLYLGLFLGAKSGIYANAFVSIANWIVVVTFMPMIVSYVKKIRKMKKEKKLYE